GSQGDRIRYELLLLLPILWLALQGSRGELVVGIGGMTAGVILPNPPDAGPRAGGGEGLFALGVAAGGGAGPRVGGAARRAAGRVGRVRRQASDVASVTRVVREVASATDAADARDVVCRAALEIVDAQVALLLEPDGPDHMRVAAAWGSEVATGTLVPVGGI